MRRSHTLVTALALAAIPVFAQTTDEASEDESPGFFGRLFGTDEASTDEDQGGLLERLIEDNLSGEGRQVSISGFEGALSSRATLDSLTVSDEEGTWLELNDVVLDWNRAALFRGRLEVAELSAGEILIPRQPLPAEGEPPTPEASGFSLPDLPVSVRIETLSAERISVGEAVVGVPIEASMNGSLALADGEGNASLTIDRLDGEGEIGLDANYANDTENLAVDLRVVEGPDGLVANLIDLPGKPSVDLTVTGDAPLSDFVANIRLATDGEERLTGTVQTLRPDNMPEGALVVVVDLGGDVAPLFAPDYQAFFGSDVALDARVSMIPESGTRIENLSLTAEALTLDGTILIGADGLPDLIDVTGAVASDSGGPVLLPIAGPPTEVRRVDLVAKYDASEGETWVGSFEIADLSRPGFSAEALSLNGDGTISPNPQSVGADFDFSATRLDLGDPNAAEALGETVTGGMVVDWRAGAPIEITNLAIDGESYGLSGQATISQSENGPRVDGGAEVRADRLSVFSGLAGRRLGGSANLTTTFDAEPLGGFFDLTAQGQTNDLVVSQEQADQILAGEVRLDLSASRDESGIRAELRTLETPNASLVGQAALKSGGSSLSLSGSLADASILLPDVPGPIRLTASAEEDRDRVWTWTIDAGLEGTRLNASGSALDVFGTPVIAATGRLEAEDLADFSTLAQRRLAGAVALDFAGEAVTDLSRANATLGGTVTNIETGIPEADTLLAGEVTIDVDASVAGEVYTVRNSSVSGPEIDLRADAILLPEAGRFDISGRIADAARVLSGAPAGPLTFAANGAQDNVDWTVEATASGAGANLLIDGTALDPLGIPGFDGRIRGDIADLSVFANLAGRSLSGSVSLEASGTATADLTSLDVTAELDSRNLAVGDPRIDPIVSGEISADLSAVRQGETITVRELALNGTTLEANATDLTVTLGAVPTADGTISASVSNLSVFSALAGRPLSGSAAVDAIGTVSSDLSSLDLRAEIDSRNLAIGDPRIDPILSGEINANLSAERQGESITVRELVLDGATLDANATGLTVELGAVPTADGSISVAIPELSAFSALAGRTLSGRAVLEAEGAVSTDLSTLDVVARAEADNVGIGDTRIDPILSGTVRASVEAIRTGDAVTASVLQIESQALSVSADGLRVTLGNVPTAEGRVVADAEDLSVFRGLANLPLQGRISLEAEGSGAADLSAFDVVASASGSGIAIGNAQADRILAGDLTASLDAEKSGESIALQTLTLSTALLDVDASGALRGEGSEIDLSGRLVDVAPFVSGFSGPLTVDGSVGQQSGGGYVVDILATGPGGITADVSGTAAQDFGSVNLDVNGNAPLGLANQFLGPRAISGTLRFDLSVNGPPALSSVSGRIDAPDARLVDPSLRIALDDINLAASLAGGQATLDTTARVEGGGSLSITGPITLSGNFPANLSIRLNDVFLSDPRLYETILGGTLSVNGGLTNGAAITGDLSLGETNIRIPSTGIGGAGAVPEIIHLNETPPIRRTRSRAGLLDRNGSGSGGSGGGGGFPLSITITAPNQIFIRGRGLDSEFGGRLQIGGTTSDVIPSGAFELIRGRLDILGQRLTITEATVTLQGSFVPFIRIRAATDAQDFDIFINVIGPASDPEITFNSEPELPQEEVLSRLLFGRGLDTLSPIQAARLALAVRTLAGRGGEGIVGNIREGAGLADFDVTTDEEGNAAVRAGAYLSENLYTDVTVGATGETELNLNLDLSRSVTIKGSVSNEGESSIGIFYERDY